MDFIRNNAIDIIFMQSVTVTFPNMAAGSEMYFTAHAVLPLNHDQNVL